MNFLTRLAVAALALALVVIAPARATTYTTKAASLEDGPYCKRSSIRSFDRSLERTVGGMMLVDKTAPPRNVGSHR